MLTSVVQYLRTGDFVYLKEAVSQGLTYDEYRSCIGAGAKLTDLDWVLLLRGQVSKGHYDWLQVLTVYDRTRFILRYSERDEQLIRYHNELLNYEMLSLGYGLGYLTNYLHTLRVSCPNYRPDILYEGTIYFECLDNILKKHLKESSSNELIAFRQSLEAHLIQIEQYEWFVFTECCDMIKGMLLELDTFIM